MAKKKATRPFKKNRNLPRDCYFCKEKKTPNFKEVGDLLKFSTERGKIIPRSRNGLCASHQKSLTVSVKHARHLALLPFIVRV